MLVIVFCLRSTITSKTKQQVVKLIGNIDEHYEGIGDITSAIYLIEKEPFIQCMKHHSFGQYFKNLAIDAL